MGKTESAIPAGDLRQEYDRDLARVLGLLESSLVQEATKAWLSACIRDEAGRPGMGDAEPERRIPGDGDHQERSDSLGDVSGCDSSAGGEFKTHDTAPMAVGSGPSDLRGNGKSVIGDSRLFHLDTVPALQVLP